MSTNPFRRSSLKTPSSSNDNVATASGPVRASDISFDAATPLSVNTKVPSSSQKHVNFASPPAIPISPVSYPPSPESTRISPAFHIARPVIPAPTDYSNALQSDPFRVGAEAQADEGDKAIEEALINAKVNTALAAPPPVLSTRDAVRNTLGKFASAPRKQFSSASDDGRSSASSAAQRQTMDVDAFKRLLMTGDSGHKSGNVEATAVTSRPTAITTPLNDNSSGTDTASTSQRSLFDHGLARDDLSETSDDDTDEEVSLNSNTPSVVIDGRKKPPTPKPRRGRSAKEEQRYNSIENTATPATANLQGATPSSTTTTPKKPPTPPLARKRSQNSGVSRTTSSRNSSSSEVDAVPTSIESNAKPPPPPRSRRPASIAERRPSTDLPPTAEEPDSAEVSTPYRKSSDTRPPPPPARNSSKRVSVNTINPPPLPPPRRGRGSSRSSVDSQRPPMSVILGSTSVDQPGADHKRSDRDGGQASSNSAARDILADLAALQKEVDDARLKTDS